MNLLRGWLAPRVGPAGRCPEVRPPRPDGPVVWLGPGVWSLSGTIFYTTTDNYRWWVRP